MLKHDVVSAWTTMDWELWIYCLLPVYIAAVTILGLEDYYKYS